MIQPVSLKSNFNFKGVENNNFKGVNAAVSQNGALLEGRNTREDYSSAVKAVNDVQDQFTVGSNLNTIA